MYYSPFVDKKGNPLPINSIRRCHLKQIQDMEEGHHIEFKKFLEDGGKAQLAKEIASFANCEGGWLLVGVADDRELCPVPKADYSQKIGKIITRVSPYPQIETRFIAEADNPKKGILLVYVHEGRNPPYICNGSVYVRSGSSKEPIKPADRGNIEYLIDRAHYNQKELEKFCQCDLYTGRRNPISGEYPHFPFIGIYMKHLQSSKRVYLKDATDDATVFEIVKSTCNIYEQMQHTAHSIILKHRATFPPKNSLTPMVEIYHDLSFKALIPLGLSEGDKPLVCSALSRLCNQQLDISDMKIAAGSPTLNAVFGALMTCFLIMKKYGAKNKEYAFCVEVKDAEECVLFFDSTKYNEYVSKNGIPYVNKVSNRSRIVDGRDMPTNQNESITFLMFRYVLPTFGFDVESAKDIWLEETNTKYK